MDVNPPILARPAPAPAAAGGGATNPHACTGAGAWFSAVASPSDGGAVRLYLARPKRYRCAAEYFADLGQAGGDGAELRRRLARLGHDGLAVPEDRGGAVLYAVFDASRVGTAPRSFRGRARIA